MPNIITIIIMVIVSTILMVGCTEQTDNINNESKTPMSTIISETKTPRPIGTGVLLQYNKQEYVVTALHVARECDSEPLIDYKGKWTKSAWRTIGLDAENDVAVLQRVGDSDNKIAELAAKYGKGGTVLGSQAVALGFPAPPITWMRITENQRPLPISVSISLYYTPTGTHYSGGYLNHGFSGGPVIAWSGANPTIVGIITKKHLVETPYQIEHSGIIAFADIKIAEHILETYHKVTSGRSAPTSTVVPSNEPEKLQPPSLITAEMLDSVILLGCEL